MKVIAQLDHYLLMYARRIDGERGTPISTIIG